MKVNLIRYTQEPERTAAIAARLCYSSKTPSELEESLTTEKTEELLNKIMNSGHLSVLEHIAFTFGIEGISRVTSHQLVRHRLASYSQQSQRYVKIKSNEYFVLPKSIKDSESGQKIEQFFSSIFDLYQDLLDNGTSKEDARYILPNATKTNIIMTMNARELLHFLHLRHCKRAQWEIRGVAVKIHKIVKQIAPVIFKNAGASCINGPCDQGEFSCGDPYKRGEL